MGPSGVVQVARVCPLSGSIRSIHRNAVKRGYLGVAMIKVWDKDDGNRGREEKNNRDRPRVKFMATGTMGTEIAEMIRMSSTID
jgi:hypothetical protein